MEEVFFKSALREGGPHLLDSSLALPAEPGPRSPAAACSTNRSLRVQQQVQLTLARRARRSESNGSIYCQRKSTKIFDAADGPGANMKPNRTDCNYSSLSSRHLRRPSRRVEVSPPSSPEVPRGHVNHSSLRYGTYAHSGHAPSHRWGTTMNRPFGCDSFHRYAFSEAPRVPQLHTTSAALGRFHQISHRQTVGPPPPPPPPVFTNAEFHHSGEFGSFLSRDQTAVGQEKHRTFGLNGDVMLGAVQPDEGVSWLAQVKRGRGQSLRRMKSYPPSNTSVEVDIGRRVEVEVPVQIQTMTLKSANRPPDMTLERAVNLLTQDNEDTLISAAGYIQNQCLRGAEAKKIVFYLRGIEKLLQLLCNDNEEVQRVAAGALRNVVYQSSENKMEVKENDGLANILQTLKNSRDVETRRDLTGLLWNLSSHDLLKEHLSREALPVLTRSVLVPSSGLSEGENPKDQLLADDDVFHNATGCLRNLSSAGPDGRKAMRACEDLIDSLVYYIRGAIADYKTDDKVSALKSTENCVCILHNLSYQMEAELPQLHSRQIRESRQSFSPKPKDIGCFAHRGAKISENPERQCPLLEEKANPRGMEWLWSSITIRMYLSLMARSVRHCTQEAAIGALQNITAGNGELIESITFTIVQRENGLHHVKRMLEEGQSDVKRTAIALIKNISCYQELQPSIVKEVLPELVEMLPDDDTGADRPTEVTVSLCNILNNLSQNRQHVIAIVGEGALPKIINISAKDSGYGPTRAGQAACVLLHSMWRHTDLHGAYRKCGYRKADFINSRTSKAVSSG